MSNIIFKEYKELVDQIKELEAKKEILSLQLMDEIDDNGGKSLETQYGTFSCLGRKVWKYSDSITNMNKAVYEAKKKEEVDGIAMLEKITSYIRLLPSKE